MLYFNFACEYQKITVSCMDFAKICDTCIQHLYDISTYNMTYDMACNPTTSLVMGLRAHAACTSSGGNPVHTVPAGRSDWERCAGTERQATPSSWRHRRASSEGAAVCLLVSGGDKGAAGGVGAPLT